MGDAFCSKSCKKEFHRWRKGIKHNIYRARCKLKELMSKKLDTTKQEKEMSELVSLYIDNPLPNSRGIY